MKKCKADDCSRPHYGLGYCQAHYMNFKRNGQPDPLGPTPCAVGDCDKPIVGRGYCRKHYMRLLRTGSVERTSGTTDSVCKVDDCQTRTAAKGWCMKHYKEDYRRRNGRKVYGKRKKE